MQHFSSDLLNREITHALSELGGKEHLRGFHVLRYLVEVELQKPNPSQDYFQVAYQKAAQKDHRSVRCIQKQCRYAIRSIWNHYCDNEAALQKFFPGTAQYIPTTHEFVFAITKNIYNSLTKA